MRDLCIHVELGGAVIEITQPLVAEGVAETIPLSVVVIARNEEALIGSCLEHVARLVDETIVVDMESEDRTAEIARSWGALVVPHARITNFDLARTPGIRIARNDWILVVDADEEPTPKLLVRIGEIVRTGAADAALVPRANLALSGFAPHEAGFPEPKLRLFRRSMVDLDGYKGEIHTFYELVPGARLVAIEGVFPECCLLHFTNPALEPFWEKVNRYTSEEARSRYGARTGPIRVRELWLPLKVFLRRWLKGKGWKDGWRGFWLCWISGVYEGLVLAKMWEMSLHDGTIPDARMARDRMRRVVDGAL